MVGAILHATTTEASVFYTDLGMSPGMQSAYASAREDGRAFDL